MASGPTDLLAVVKLRVTVALSGAVKKDKWDKIVGEDSLKAPMERFLQTADCKLLLVAWRKGDELIASNSIPSQLPTTKRKSLVFIKLSAVALNSRNFADHVHMLEITGSPLEQLNTLSRAVFFPLVERPENRDQWAGAAARDILFEFNRYVSDLSTLVAETHGKTELTFPPTEIYNADCDSQLRLRTLLAAFQKWNSQLRRAANAEPSSMFTAGRNPDPLDEIQFWKKKETNLTDLCDALKSKQMRLAVEFLEEEEADCVELCNFYDMCDCVDTRLYEASLNVCYLKPLQKEFDMLRDALDFTTLPKTFGPLLHKVLLIWKHSETYTSAERLRVLISEVCNALIAQASKCVGGEEIMGLIEDEAANEAIDKISDTFDVCQQFENCFLECRSKARAQLTAATDVVDSERRLAAWNQDIELMFGRMRVFKQRCADLTEFTSLIQQFAKMERIYISGNNGRVLTAQIREIYEEVIKLKGRFQTVSYDLMDITAEDFDTDFYAFRSSIKALEKRLVGILSHAFADATSITARFQLLDAFDDLLQRPILKGEFRSKKQQLIGELLQELRDLETQFQIESPPLPKNLPPCSGAIVWCRGFKQRLEPNVAKLRALVKGQIYLEGEDLDEDSQRLSEEVDDDQSDARKSMTTVKVKEVEEWYASFCKDLSAFEEKQKEKFKKEVAESSEDSLKQNVLARDAETGALRVNFEPALGKVLREAHYFQLNGIEIPAKAVSIYEKNDEYKSWRCQLQIVVNMYNTMHSGLQASERPLLQTSIDEIDAQLRRGLCDLNWKNRDVDAFIADVQQCTHKVYTVYECMKNNVKQIRKLLQDFAERSLCERKSKPVSADEFSETLEKLHKQRFGALEEINVQIGDLMDGIFKALKVASGEPKWKSFVADVQSQILEDLSSTVSASVQWFLAQVTQSTTKSTTTAPMQPLLEIQLALFEGIQFTTSIDGKSTARRSLAGMSSRRSSLMIGAPVMSSRRGSVAEAIEDLSKKSVSTIAAVSIWERMRIWVQSFFTVGEIIRKIDGTNDSFVEELRAFPAITEALKSFDAMLEANMKECEDYKREFFAFEHLYRTDRTKMFREFLATTDASAAKKGRDDASELPALERFQEKIEYYNDIQKQISSKQTPIQISWLKIDAQPLKLSLQTWVSKWLHTFTAFLKTNVEKEMQQLYEFVDTVRSGLKAEVQSGDLEGLKGVLGLIHNVRSRQKETQASFAPLTETIKFLRNHGVDVGESTIERLKEAPFLWEQIVKEKDKVQDKVNPLLNEQVDNIKQKVWAFNDEVVAFRQLFRDNAPFVFRKGRLAVELAYDKMLHFHKAIGSKEKDAAALNQLERLFNIPESKYRQLAECRSENKLLKSLWDMISMVYDLFDSWRSTLWNDIDTEQLLSAVNKLMKRTNAMDKEIRGWKGFQGLQSEVKRYQTVLPLVNLLHSPTMKDRHWKQLMQVTATEFRMGSSFSLGDMLDLGLHSSVESVEEVVEISDKEAKIETQICKLKALWSGSDAQKFEYGTHEETGVALVRIPEELLVSLEESLSVLQSLKGQGKYVQHFLAEVNTWENHLGLTESVITDWLTVQTKWSSLQSIFVGSADIRQQLPDDTQRFDEIDKEWRNLMLESVKVTEAVLACNREGHSATLEEMKKGLELCEKSLNQYLETKKMAFPRFYFLSNVALLDLLSNGNNPHKVQSNMVHCFDNVRALEFAKDADGNPTKDAIGMYSKDGDEYVAFRKPFRCEGAVEDWLNGLVEMMRSTLREILEKAKFSADQWELEKPRHEWLYDYCAQIALTASQIIWTEETEVVFEEIEDGKENALKEYYKVCERRLEDLIKLVIGSKLPKSDRTKIMTLITVDVHNRDVIHKLIEDRIQSATEFAWQRQMRYSWEPEKAECSVHVADWKCRYSFEYIGNTGRLVITPLTDRCYITLTQALKLMMGGAPAGPAGTGKTETTKDLGRAVGLPVYVFNCSEQMNVLSLGNIFKGLCQTGAWGCFDEFNRIPIEVLSVVATQVGSFLNALRAQKSQFDLMGTTIKLVETVGVFITMNPGYAGRTELPENLKALFRSCAMVVPDMELICENMLMSEGFLSARPLAHKFITLYEQSKKLLSNQMHYDWGLRATKAVLRKAGQLKRDEPDVDEALVLMRALRDFNLPKIVSNDKPIFLRLIEDLFCGLKIERKIFPTLNEAIIEVTKESGLQAEEMFVRKVSDLAELFDVRHSVFVIGAAGAGKSQVWRTLEKAFNRLDKKCVHEIMNPKAVANDELYGWLSAASGDWNDGILSTVMRNMSVCDGGFTQAQKCKWLVLDGDIDPEWIESLNTVMDDNKVLTLVSNERIPLTASMRLLFEVSHLKNATPATVSRAGILFINKVDIGWRPMLDSWIDQREDESERSTLRALFNKYITADALEHIRRSFKCVVPTSDVQKLQTLCYILEGVLPLIRATKSKSEAEIDNEIYEKHFMYAAIWAFGGGLLVDESADNRLEFSNWWKTNFQLISYPIDQNVDGSNTVFDYFYDEKTNEIQRWDSRIRKYERATSGPLLVNSIMVDTPETARLLYHLDLLVANQKPAMFVGNSGTGKTAIIKGFLRALDEDKYVSAGVNLNSYTDATSLRRIMQQHVDKRSGRNYGPSGGKKLVYFVDDLNMPYVDTYGTQSPVALVRQHIDHRLWYDTDESDPNRKKKFIRDCQYVAAMNHKAGSFTVNERLMSHFALFATSTPSKKDATTIYKSILDSHLLTFADALQKLALPITSGTVDLLETISRSAKFRPSSTKFHYQFSMRDVSNTFQGLVSSKECTLEPTDFISLWRHECMRVFGDRMVDQSDVDAFEAIVNANTKKYFPDFVLPAADKKVMFTSFAGSRTPDTEGVYLPCDSYSTLNESLESFLTDYNENNAQMPLVLFDTAMDHVCRIARVINQPRGSALLVGVGGSGKQSLTKLASWICGYEVFQIQVTRTYGEADLLEDIKALYMKAGVKGKGVSFLLTDSHIVDEAWLVFINDLLSNGDIPQLFADDEKDSIYNSLRTEAKRSGVNVDNKTAMHEFFIGRVRKNLHLVLCMSPVGEVFRVRCRKFPALINCTSMDWFYAWPRDALCSVAERFLGESELLQETLSDEMRTNIAHYMAEVHLSVNKASQRYFSQERRYNYTTPKSFLELIELYKSMFKKESDKIDEKTQRLDKGIATLAKTSKDVASLQAELEQKLIIVEQKKWAANTLIERCGKEKVKVDAEKAIAMEEKAKAQVVLDKANSIRAECDVVLKKAMPALEAAKTAVNCLTKASLTELKSLKTPDPKILDVTKAVLILKEKEKRNHSWKRSVSMMKNVVAFKRELETFNKESIDESLLRLVAPILKKDYFNPESMAKISMAAANLATWVVAVVEYNSVYKEVAPKMEAAEAATQMYTRAMDKLNEVEAKVAAKEELLRKVTCELEEAVAEKNRVQADADACLDRKKLAERLVNGLSEENVRWSIGVEKFHEEQRTLVGDVLLQCAFVSYIGAFDQNFREQLWQNCWLKDLVSRKIPVSENIVSLKTKPMDVLSTAPQRAKWANEGLPVDCISIENAAMVSLCSRWPLLIDPQQQGVKWIRSREPDLVVINLNQPRWLSVLTRAVESGQSVLIENVSDTMDPALEPILARAIIRKGRSMRIRISGEEKDYDPNFKLYVQTKLSNPCYKPEIFAQCTLINFIVTEQGLEEQLLALVVNDEKPELEQTKQQLMRSINEYMVSLNDLENELLWKLSNAPDDILSDVSLIESLENTKKASKEIEKSVLQAKVKETEINEARNQYRPVASEASWIYFLLIQMNAIDHMYQYSLDAFTTFFDKALERAPKSTNVQQRVEYLRDEIRLVVFTWVSRGLFEKHKLIFSSQLLFKLMQKGAMKRELNAAHFEYLIFGQRKYGEENPIAWLSDGAWQAVCKLSELEGMERFVKDLVASPKRFKEWYLKTQPEIETLPLDWRKLDEKDPFAKLCVVRALRPDRITSAVEKFVREEMPDGRAYTELDAGKCFAEVLEISLDDANNKTPVFFILSPGSDPVNDVYALALKTGIVDAGKYQRVAMGQGQDVVAMQKLAVGALKGHWVVLENIHLMPRWCKELEKALDNFAQSDETHADFRVFLSADPSEGIPIGILERSIKLTNEPPQGMKANLKRAFASFPKEEFDFRESQVKAIQFALCWFHAVMIERKKFGPKGWNAVYPFNTGDLTNSGTVLVHKLEAGGGTAKIPWADLQYIFGEIMYGGHITDDWDRLLCMTYLRFYMKNELFEDYDLVPFVRESSAASEATVRFLLPSDRSHEEYFEYIDANLPAENPLMLGLHPNTEIAVRSEQCNALFAAIVQLAPRSGAGAGGSGQTPQQRVASVLQEILEKVEDLGFDLNATLSNLTEEERGPYQYVFLQEIERMNALIVEIKRSLKELDKGLHGELTMSERMEELQNALFLETVPDSWSKLAYPSQRPLSSWVQNLLLRNSQLQTWVATPTSIPAVVNVSYLFNPLSFLTAVMQTTARRNNLELDRLAIVTEVTRKSVEDIDEPARDGAYICGLNLEGARWNSAQNALDESEPREMFCPLPVVNCKTVLATKLDTKGVYHCPVYQTQMRGPTYVFTAPLRTKDTADKWILAGAVIVMDYVQ